MSRRLDRVHQRHDGRNSTFAKYMSHPAVLLLRFAFAGAAVAWGIATGQYIPAVTVAIITIVMAFVQLRRRGKDPCP